VQPTLILERVSHPHFPPSLPHPDRTPGGDRGGVTDLIDSIKATKIPIVCICNDKYKQSLKSLKNHCLELEWRRPTKVQVAARLNRVCAAEGLSLNAVRPARPSCARAQLLRALCAAACAPRSRPHALRRVRVHARSP